MQPQTAEPLGAAHYRDRPLDIELGRDIAWWYAHYGMACPIEAPSEFVEAHKACRSNYPIGKRSSTRFERKWAMARFNAWLRNRKFDLTTLTPDYIEKVLAVDYCPITRLKLTVATGEDTDWSLDRVQNNCGYAAGNVVIMSVRANAAKGSASFAEARKVAMRLAQHGGEASGLDATQWARMASLIALRTSITDMERAGLPMLVAPPRDIVTHAIPSAQYAVSHYIAFRKEDAVRRFITRIPGKRARVKFNAFRAALCGALRICAKDFNYDNPGVWLLEDAWWQPMVSDYWRRFSLEAGPERLAKSLGSYRRLEHEQLADWKERTGELFHGYCNHEG